MSCTHVHYEIETFIPAPAGWRIVYRHQDAIEEYPLPGRRHPRFSSAWPRHDPAVFPLSLPKDDR